MKSFPDTSLTSTTTPSTSDETDDLRPKVLVVATDRDAFGIPVEQVREVIRMGALHWVPGSPSVLRGITNVRGTIVTVLDLQAILSGERAVTVGSIVLVEYGSRLIGLAGRAVYDCRANDEPPESQAEPPPGGVKTRPGCISSF